AGEPDGEPGAASLLALDFDPASARADHGMGHRKAEPDSPYLRLGGLRSCVLTLLRVERGEQAAELFRRNSNPAVLHAKEYFTVLAARADLDAPDFLPEGGVPRVD